MKRKIMPVIAAALATGTIFSGTAYAAPKDSQDVAYNVKAKGPNAEFVDQVKNQGQVNQLKSIDKQLDKIERILMEYKMKLNDIDEDDEDLDQDTDDVEDADQADDTDQDTDDAEDADQADDTDQDTDDVEDTDQADDTDQDAGDVEDTDQADDTDQDVDDVEDTDQADDTDQDTDDVEDVDQADDTDQDTDDAEDADQADDSDQDTDDADDESDDVENDLEDNPGYSGKFKALQNRLNAVTNRLDSLSAKAIDEVALTERYDRVKALQSEVGAVLLTINQIQDKVTKEIEQDDAVEEKESVKEKDLMKEWKIQFSKALDEKTLSELDIIVLDQDKNLVETTFTYSVATKSVTISPLQPYQSGKTYTLYIGKKISSKEGKGLKNSVKMNFSIQ